MILGILIPVVFIIISSYIIWKSTESFAISADFLGRNMSGGVKGATINAIASSMPEFLTTLFFMFTIKDIGGFDDNFSGGLGVTAGSAIFNILIIPAAIFVFGTAAFRKKGFKIDKKVVQRDGIFLLLANIILIFLVSKKKLDSLDGLFLIFIYIFYLLSLRKDFGFKKKNKKTEKKFEIPFVKLNLFHFLRLDLNHIILNGRKLNKTNAWTNLILSTLVMSMGTWLLVKGTELLGNDDYNLLGLDLKGLDLPILFLSVLLTSAATSIPDTMLSIRDAKKGNYDDSISNALGSNIFDISFALGLPLLIYTLIHPDGVIMSEQVRIGGVTVWLLLLAINILIIPIFIYSKKVSSLTGIFLLFVYILFVTYIIAENTRFAIESNFVKSILDFLHRLSPSLF